MSVEAKRIINGTFGELWLDNEYVAECYKSQAKIEFNKEEVKQCGAWGSDHKTTGWKGTGSVGLHKVNSRMAIKVGQMAKQKKEARFTLISKLADPDAFGAERVSLSGVSFDDLTLFDWEAGTVGGTEHPFTFSDYEFLDLIQPQ